MLKELIKVFQKNGIEDAKDFLIMEVDSGNCDEMYLNLSDIFFDNPELFGKISAEMKELYGARWLLDLFDLVDADINYKYTMKFSIENKSLIINTIYHEES